MTDTADHSAHPGYAAYGWNPAAGSASGERTDQLGRALWIAVTILGPLILAVSVGSPVPLDFPVRLSMLAAAVAAVGLLPGQSSRGWLIVALAVTGFCDALLPWIRAGDPRWALTVVMVLNALQALVAVGALLHQARVYRSARATVTPDYSAYARMVQAYQAYAVQYQQPLSEPYTAAGQATARGQASANAHTAETSRESFAQLQARYAQHGVGASAQHSRDSSADRGAGPVTDPGVPGANRGAPEDPYRGYRQNPGKSTVEPTGF